MRNYDLTLLPENLKYKGIEASIWRSDSSVFDWNKHDVMLTFDSCKKYGRFIIGLFVNVGGVQTKLGSVRIDERLFEHPWGDDIECEQEMSLLADRIKWDFFIKDGHNNIKPNKKGYETIIYVDSIRTVQFKAEELKLEE